MILKMLFLSICLTSIAFAKEREVKLSVLDKLGPYSYEVDYFASKDFYHLIDKWEHLGEPTLERHSFNINNYKNKYYRYLAYAVKSHLQAQRSPASTYQNPSTMKFVHQVPQHLSLIAFKTGELESSCSSVVEKAKAWGAKTIAYYHPVHYSGGNGKIYKMPANPVYGKHWRYELAHHFKQSEFEACLDKIAGAGLRLHYIPHLESIVTLNGEEEWRLLGGIPIDEHYFHYSFGPLLTYLKNKKNFKKHGSLDITIAAEIDPMVFSDTAQVLSGKHWLKVHLAKFGVSGTKFYLNTNGDFYHGHNLPQVKKTDCSALTSLIKDMDALTPSMYGDKGHLKKNAQGKLDLKLTIASYRSAFTNRVSELCAKNKALAGLKKVIEHKKIGFGEFALDVNDQSQNYADILSSSEKDLLFVQFWNHGQWDHIGLVADGSERLKNQLLKPRK